MFRYDETCNFNSVGLLPCLNMAHNALIATKQNFVKYFYRTTYRGGTLKLSIKLTQIVYMFYCNAIFWDKK